MGEGGSSPSVILSFDVEEHHRIEAASGIECPPELRVSYAERMDRTTRVLLERLAEARVPATFYIVGEIARSHPRLVRDIAAAGHEIGSHGWDHRRVHRFDPESFREDLQRSKEALEEASGTGVIGYRAPTFSIVRQTGWAVDVITAVGFRYDSSVFPVRHDRYGIPEAPRTPFVAEGYEHSILELPPTTYRVMGQNLPVAGGGYFRLFPLAFLMAGVRQLGRADPAVAMLYFHPWEFDPAQPRLPLKRTARMRTYVGVRKSLARLGRLMAKYRGRFRRACDVVGDLELRRDSLPRFRVPPAV